MNLINRIDENVFSTKSSTIYKKQLWRILFVIILFLPLIIVYFVCSISQMAKWYISYYLLNEASQNSIIDLQNSLAEKQINNIKQQFKNHSTMPVIVQNITDVSDSKSISWKSVGVCACMLAVLVISIGIYTEIIHLEKILDLNFKGINTSLSTEFVQIHDSIGKGVSRINDINNSQNTDLKNAFKVVSDKMDILLKISKMPICVNEKKPLRDFDDLGDFS